MNFKPMLATDADLAKLRFPLLASAKLDGIRGVAFGGTLFSRSLKPIKNKHTQEMFRRLDYYDGELIVGDPTAKDCMQQTSSGVMTTDGTPDVKFHVFDHVEAPDLRYLDRYRRITEPELGPHKNVVRHPQYHIADLPTLLALEEAVLDAGYEGLILRDPQAPYKYGRSTVREGYLLKMKRFVDAEFEVVGFEERMHNGNIATVSELGRTKRSSHQENKVGRGDLGALVLRLPNGCLFNCGAGFDDAQRTHIWEHQAEYIGQLAKVKYFPVGMKDAPRHPVFIGWRDRSDT